MVAPILPHYFLFPVPHEYTGATVIHSAPEVSSLNADDQGPIMVLLFIWTLRNLLGAMKLLRSLGFLNTTSDLEGNVFPKSGSYLRIFQFCWMTHWISKALVLYFMLNLMELVSFLSVCFFMGLDSLFTLCTYSNPPSLYCTQYFM